MKKEQIQENGISRRGFLKRTALAGAAICIAPALEKVTAAEKAITGKSSVSAATIPAGMAAVRAQRTLSSGKAAFTISAMGFGCMGLNHHRSQSPDEKTCIRLIHEAIERGVTLFDTAESYGYHKNEKLVGEAERLYRPRVRLFQIRAQVRERRAGEDRRGQHPDKHPARMRELPAQSRRGDARHILPASRRPCDAHRGRSRNMRRAYPGGKDTALGHVRGQC